MNWSVQRKLAAGLVTVLVLVVLALSLDWRNFQQLRETGSWVEHTHEVLAESEAALTIMTDVETGVRGFLGIAQDIAEWKRVEEKSKQRVRNSNGSIACASGANCR